MQRTLSALAIALCGCAEFVDRTLVEEVEDAGIVEDAGPCNINDLIAQITLELWALYDGGVPESCVQRFLDPGCPFPIIQQRVDECVAKAQSGATPLLP